MRSRSVISHLAAFVAGAVCAAVLVDAALVGAVPDRGADRSHDRYRTLDAYAQALSYILNQYVDPVDERKMIYASVRGMVDELDPHSAFLPPRRYRQLRQDTEGEFAGIGITVVAGDSPSSAPLVETVVPQSPAARAGVREGDALISIDGKATVVKNRARSARSLHSVLRGPAGSRTTLELRRRAGAARKVTLVREQIKVPTVEWDWFEPGLGYIAVSRFQEATSADVRSALVSIRNHERNRTVRGLVLDLRGNPGGLLDQGIRVADLFIDKGVLVTVGGRKGGAVEREMAHAAGTWDGFPMIVLVDQNSASAAEIVAGALQDHGRAVVVGLPTYGKGSVQTFLDLNDGSGLKLTTSRYYTPKGKSLEGAGIKPDIKVEAFEGDDIVAGEDLPPDGAVADPGADSRTRGGRKILDELEDDLQLRTAYQMLRARAGSKP